MLVTASGHFNVAEVRKLQVFVETLVAQGLEPNELGHMTPTNAAWQRAIGRAVGRLERRHVNDLHRYFVEYRSQVERGLFPDNVDAVTQREYRAHLRRMVVTVVEACAEAKGFKFSTFEHKPTFEQLGAAYQHWMLAEHDREAFEEHQRRLAVKRAARFSTSFADAAKAELSTHFRVR